MERTHSNGENGDRTSLEYFEDCLYRAFATNDEVFGLPANKPPEDFEELKQVVEMARNTDCGVSNEIDSVLEIIGSKSDPDSIVRQLPYYENSIVFILPSGSIE